MEDPYLVIREDSMSVICPVLYLDSVDAAVTHFLETGRDQLVRIETLSGEEYGFLASSVLGFFVTSKESRKKSVQYEAERRAEDREWREEFGVEEDDPSTSF